jgi:hypothetical protein
MRSWMLIAPWILAGSASPQDSTAARQSRDEVLSQPPTEVARTLLGDIASRFVTMTIERNGEVPVEIAFATAPQGTGKSGLCEATVLRIELWREENRAASAQVRGYSVNTVYKVIGALDGAYGTRLPNGRRETQRCVASGEPVLPSPPDNPHAPRFFVSVGNYLLGIAALQGAIEETRRGRYQPIECDRREPDDCRDARAEFAALELRNLASLDVIRLDPVQPNYRLQARFVVEPGRQSSFGWQVSIEFNADPFPGEWPRAADFAYRRTRLYRY